MHVWHLGFAIPEFNIYAVFTRLRGPKWGVTAASALLHRAFRRSGTAPLTDGSALLQPDDVLPFQNTPIYIRCIARNGKGDFRCPKHSIRAPKATFCSSIFQFQCHVGPQASFHHLSGSSHGFCDKSVVRGRNCCRCARGLPPLRLSF